MIKALTRWTDQILGHGDAAITVPIFDGALKPNQLLQEATTVLRFDAPEDVATDGEAVYVADGCTVQRVNDLGRAEEVFRVNAPISSLSCIGGGIAVCIGGREIRIIGGRWDGAAFTKADDRAFNAVNAIATNHGRLVVSDGSLVRGCDQWRHDLMELGNTGRVIEIDLEKRSAKVLADRLHHAFGVGVTDGAVWVSESWKHRVTSLGSGTVPVLDRLPGYPSRMTPAAGGGFWLTVFAARTQLVEFVLRETAYRKRMVATIQNPDLWIAPQLRSWQSLQEPLQYPRVKRLGKVKPWAPPTSYGLVVRLDERGVPLYSMHSRADGSHHGIVAAVECRDQLYVLSKGAKKLLKLDIEELQSEVRQ